MKTVLTGEVSWLDISFWGPDREAASPTSATYVVEYWDGSAWQTIRTSTAITPIAAEVRIELTASDNTLQDASADSELHRVCTTAVFGLNDEKKEQYVYKVLKADC